MVLRPHLFIGAVGSTGADLRLYGVLIRVELLVILTLILVRNETLIQVFCHEVSFPLHLGKSSFIDF